jgi:hypothetical protein
MAVAMSKAHHQKARKPAPTNLDGGVYIGILMIGAFGIWLITIFVDSPDAWKQGLIGYVIAVGFLVNFSTWQVCAGKTIAGWKQSLARLPLRCVGYGTKGGKPLAAAHGSDRAKMMLYVSIAFSFVAVLGITLLLIRT